MSTQYSLKVTNNSNEFQNLCVYQKPVDVGVPNAMSLAWLTAPAWPSTTVDFTWSIDYSFMWSPIGALAPGVTFQAQQIVPADPDSLATSQIELDYRDGAFTLGPGATAGSPQLGSLAVRALAAVPADVAAVGIGMSDTAVFAWQARPNTSLVFTPHPEYWITAGTFGQGEVLDIEQITNEASVPFDATYSMQAILDSQNNWTVSRDAV